MFKQSVGLSPLPVTVTTRIITFLVGDPYKPSFATVTGRGDNPNNQGLHDYVPHKHHKKVDKPESFGHFEFIPLLNLHLGEFPTGGWNWSR